jgi:hypothetical protein
MARSDAARLATNQPVNKSGLMLSFSFPLRKLQLV